MPELPDVNLYVTRLNEKLAGHEIESFKVFSPFVVRSTGFATANLVGLTLRQVSRLGKRIVFEFDNEVVLVVHLMIAGRFIWSDDREKVGKPSKIELFRIGWDNGTLSLNEASSKKRAGIWLLQGMQQLQSLDRKGLDLFRADHGIFRERLIAKNRTLKRALTDPTSFDGIGNAYSDEILFRAQLSPIKLTHALSNEEIERLFEASRSTLSEWTETLKKAYPKFPKSSEITAFRKDFNAHGRYGLPCRVCGAPIQRIVGTDNEMNYCARCQCGGVIHADRSLSRLLKDEWPRSIDELMAEG